MGVGVSSLPILAVLAGGELIAWDELSGFDGEDEQASPVPECDLSSGKGADDMLANAYRLVAE